MTTDLLPVSRLREILAAAEDYIENWKADLEDDPHSEPVGEFNSLHIAALVTENLAMREAARKAWLVVDEVLTGPNPDEAIASLIDILKPLQETANAR